MIPPDRQRVMMRDLLRYQTETEATALPWEKWIRRLFPKVCFAGFSERHRKLWAWFEGIEANQPMIPRVEVWGRGGGKSSSIEMGCVRLAAKLTRRFVLYVSGTQIQADLHVDTIGQLLLMAGMDRALAKYGTSKGWRRSQLRTANGFNVAAIGLDTAGARGMKLDEFRPDLLIFDDIDSLHDSIKTVEKKKAAITSTIMPAGAVHCAVLFVQNLIHEDSIVNQLVTGEADFLLDREVPTIEPAVRGLKTEIVPVEGGRNRYKVTGGEATWEGQNLSTVERQINTWGLSTFLRESQHEISGATGYFFDTSRLGSVKPIDVPPLRMICSAWDLAATEGGGDHTANVVMGVSDYGKYYVLAVIAGQWASERVRACIRMSNEHYGTLYPYMTIRLPQDPGQAGKAQADQMQRDFEGITVQAVTGKKSSRATGLSEQVNLGNVFLVEEDLPDWLKKPCGESGKPLLQVTAWQAWHHQVKEEFRRFKENERDQNDDRVDAGADAYNDLQLPVICDDEPEIQYAW